MITFIRTFQKTWKCHITRDSIFTWVYFYKLLWSKVKCRPNVKKLGEGQSYGMLWKKRNGWMDTMDEKRISLYKWDGRK